MKDCHMNICIIRLALRLWSSIHVWPTHVIRLSLSSIIWPWHEVQLHNVANFKEWKDSQKLFAAPYSNWIVRHDGQYLPSSASSQDSPYSCRLWRWCKLGFIFLSVFKHVGTTFYSKWFFWLCREKSLVFIHSITSSWIQICHILSHQFK